jgi:hypothetical protein
MAIRGLRSEHSTSMTIYQRAKEFYAAHADSGKSLDEDILIYSRIGHVYICDRYIILAEQIERAWWIYFAIGDLRQMTDLFPYPLDWVGFRRRGTDRWLPYDRFVKLLERYANDTKQDHLGGD